MPQDNPPLLDKTMNTTESTPRNMADVLASGLANIANNVKPDASDITLDPITGMSANNVQLGISELKQSLGDKINAVESGGGVKYFYGSGTNRYCKVATINILSGNANRPIYLELEGRGHRFTSVQLAFVSDSGSDPALDFFETNGTETNFYLKKTATSTWELYYDMASSWNYVYLVRVNYYGSTAISVTVNMTGLSSLPTGCTQVTSNLDNKLDVTTMYPSTSISDCNLAKSNGIYYYNASSVNAPTTNGGILFSCIIQPAQNQGFQLAFPNNQNFVAIRVLSTSTFSAWKAISTQNI